MNRPIHTKTFKSGNSVAIRLPKALGIDSDEEFAITRRGDTLIGQRVASAAEQAERLGRFREMLAELKRIGPVGEVEARDPDIFPDRPGL